MVASLYLTAREPDSINATAIDKLAIDVIGQLRQRLLAGSTDAILVALDELLANGILDKSSMGFDEARLELLFQGVEFYEENFWLNFLNARLVANRLLFSDINRR